MSAIKYIVAYIRTEKKDLILLSRPNGLNFRWKTHSHVDTEEEAKNVLDSITDPDRLYSESKPVSWEAVGEIKGDVNFRLIP